MPGKATPDPKTKYDGMNLSEVQKSALIARDEFDALGSHAATALNAFRRTPNQSTLDALIGKIFDMSSRVEVNLPLALGLYGFAPGKKDAPAKK